MKRTAIVSLLYSFSVFANQASLEDGEGRFNMVYLFIGLVLVAMIFFFREE